MHNVGFHYEIVVEKLRWIAGVGEDAADLSCGHEHGLRFSLLHPSQDLVLTGEVELRPLRSQDPASLTLEASHQRRAHHAAVTGDPDALVLEGVEARELGRGGHCESHVCTPAVKPVPCARSPAPGPSNEPFSATLSMMKYDSLSLPFAHVRQSPILESPCPVDSGHAIDPHGIALRPKADGI